MELIVTAKTFVDQILLASGSGLPLDGCIVEAVARKALREPGAAITRLLKLRNTDAQLQEELGIAEASVAQSAVRWRIECRLNALVTSKGHLGPLVRLAVILGELDRVYRGVDLADRIDQILVEAGYSAPPRVDQLMGLFKKYEDDEELIAPVLVASIIKEVFPKAEQDEVTNRINEILGAGGAGTRAGEAQLVKYFSEKLEAMERPHLAPMLALFDHDAEDDQDDPGTEDRTFSHAPSAKLVADPTVVKHALAALINRLPSRARLPKVMWEQLMSLPLRPATDLANAIASYRHWLQTGLCFTDNRSSDAPDLGSEMLSVLSTNPSVHEAVTFIAGAAGLGLGKRLPIVQLQSTDRQSLCRTVVQLVTAEGGKKDGQRQRPKSQSLRPIHLHASRFGDPAFVLTVKGFIKPLALAYGIDLGDMSQPLDDQEYGKLLALLRQGLSLHPVLVVVHGLQVGIGRLSPLLDLVNGTATVIDIIRTLCLGHLTEPLSAQQPPLDRATLWLVSTNHEVDDLLPFTEKTCELSEDGWDTSKSRWQSVVFGKTRPSSSIAIPVETGDVPQLKGSLQDAWASRAFNVPPTDHELVLVTTIQRWAVAKGRPLAWKAQAGSAYSLPEQLMAGWLRDMVAHDQAGLWMLLAIASTTDGVCLGTLKRLVESNRGLIQNNASIGQVSQELQPAKRLLLAESIKKDFGNCVKLLDSLTAGERGKSTSKTDFSTDAITPYLPLLCVHQEQVSEHLSGRALRWEVGELGAATSVHNEPVDEGAYRGAFRSSVRFCSPTLRDAFIRAFQGLDEFVPQSSLQFSTCVQLAQYSVAVESFAQAGALLARSSMAEIISLQRRRLLIQTLYHLCCVGDLDDKIKLVEYDQRHTALMAFPRLNWRRRMLSYMVVYQQLIEDRGAWTISRRYGRSELRASLLLALAYWGSKDLLTPEYSMGSVLTGKFGSDRDSDARATLLSCLRQAQDESRYLLQLMRNLCHACTDADDLDLAEVVLELLEDKAKAVDKVENLPTTTTQHEDFEVRFQIIDTSPDDHNPKLEFTRLDDEGRRAEAADLCQRQLEERMKGVCGRWVLLGQKVIDTLGLGDGKSSPESALAFAFETINKALLDEVETVTKSIGKGASRMTSIADWAVRWAALQAEEFEELPPQLEDPKAAAKQKRKRAASLVSAWVIFWLSDELRSKIGEQPGVSGERWGRLSARYFRYGIRLSLRLARILAEIGPKSKLMSGSARFLLSYASTRTSILARDYNALFRELFQVLLLRASIARTKERLDRILGPAPVGGKAAPEGALEPPFLDAFAYMHAAERRWLELGGAGALTRRLVVERINLSQTALWNIFEQAGSQVPCEHQAALATSKTVLAMLDADLNVLKRFAEHGGAKSGSFWKSLYRWHDRRQADLREKFAMQEAGAPAAPA